MWNESMGADAFPNNASEHRDLDGDGLGDQEDPDMDGDQGPEDEKDDKSWVEFDVMEIEIAKQRKKDPRSFSQILCWGNCLLGPEDSSTSAKVANAVNIMMIGFNMLMASWVFWANWRFVAGANVFLGVLVQLLMWCVQCSDPGVISRETQAKTEPMLAEYDASQGERRDIDMMGSNETV